MAGKAKGKLFFGAVRKSLKPVIDKGKLFPSVRHTKHGEKFVCPLLLLLRRPRQTREKAEQHESSPWIESSPFFVLAWCEPFSGGGGRSSVLYTRTRPEERWLRCRKISCRWMSKKTEKLPFIPTEASGLADWKVIKLLHGDWTINNREWNYYLSGSAGATQLNAAFPRKYRVKIDKRRSTVPGLGSHLLLTRWNDWNVSASPSLTAHILVLPQSVAREKSFLCVGKLAGTNFFITSLMNCRRGVKEIEKNSLCHNLLTVNHVWTICYPTGWETRRLRDSRALWSVVAEETQLDFDGISRKIEFQRRIKQKLLA